MDDDLVDDDLAALVPDPLPLRTISTPRGVTQVTGCDCGGLDWHRDDVGGRCSIWDAPRDDALAAIDAAHARMRAFTGHLNAKLHAALGP